MARWHYHYSGLKVASELYLPEWQAFEIGQPSQDSDIEIRLEDAVDGAHTPVLNATERYFCIEGIGEYWIQDGRLIRIAISPNAGLREVRLFLLGSAWGALCYQRGLLALHASVVEVHGEAVAFCGASGAGKSSAAAWLVARGYPLIGDDLCHFDISGLQPSVYPSAPRLKLWRDALDQLGWQVDDLERDHFRMEKFHIGSFHIDTLVESQLRDDRGEHTEQRRVIGSPLPVRAIYLLAWGEAAIVRLKGLTAVFQLIESATYRGELLEPMGELAPHWQRCATLARSVPIFRFTRPQAWPAMATAMHNLVASWHSEAKLAPENRPLQLP